MRLAAYGTITTLVATGVVMQAFHQRANFYSACVYLHQSNACLMILTNFGIFLTLMFGKLLQKIFYGPLRPAEVETLYEKAWYAITETCLAMTIFRDEFHTRFVIMFTVLLFLKCFHWLGNSRVDFMEQTPPTRPWIFHLRLCSSLVILLTVDYLLTSYCVVSLMQLDKPNMLVMFAFEFAILTIGSAGVFGRYALGVIEKLITNRQTRAFRARRRRILQRRVDREEMTAEEMENTLLEEEEEGDVVGGWEGKSAFVFYLEIITDLMKLLTYLMFFAIVLTFYGLPLHIIRDVYMTVRSFIGRIRDFIAYRRATAQMNSKYPDATREEIEREPLCIVCRETMTPWNPAAAPQPAAGDDEEPEIPDERLRPKRLPCGHVLHLSCMKSWMERQQRCPTCRRPVFDEPATGQTGGGAPQGQAPQAGPGVPGVAGAPPAGPGQPERRQDGAQPGPQNNQQPQAQQPPRGLLRNFLAAPDGGLAQVLARHVAQRQQPGFPQIPDPQQPQGTPANPEQAPPTQTSNTDTTLEGNLNATLQLTMEPYLRLQELMNHRIEEQLRSIRDDLGSIRNALGVRDPSRNLPRTSNIPSIHSTPSRMTPAGSTFATPERSVPTSTSTVVPPESPEVGGTSTTNIQTEAPSTPQRTGNDTENGGIGSTPGLVPVDSTHNLNQPFPPGMQLPPGWSLVPLYPASQGGHISSTFSSPQQNPRVPSPQQQQQQQQQASSSSSTSIFQQPPTSTSSTPNPSQASPSDVNLAGSRIRRRGAQRQYSNSLHTYHNMASPRQEEPNPFASISPSSTSQGLPSIGANLAGGDTTSSQSANSQTISSPSRQMSGSNNPPSSSAASSPSRLGSISSTSRELLERRHRDAHSPRTGSNLSPASSIRNQNTSNNNQHIPDLDIESMILANQQASQNGGGATSPGRRPEVPILDTSAEHNHAVDSTHDPTQGRSPTEELRRASAGEILLSETDTAWPAPVSSNPPSDGGLSPSPSLPGSRVGSVRRDRRSSNAGSIGTGPGNGGSAVNTGMFNVIPKSQTSSTAGSPVISHSGAASGRFDVGSPSRLSLDKGKWKEENGDADGERGRSLDKGD